MKSRLSAGFCLLVSLLFLGGCDLLPDFLGETDEGPPLPGRRIAIMALDRGIRADASLADLQVQLPRPYVNGDWSQPGGVQTHAMYHLALGEKPSLQWTADVGASADGETRILAQPLVVGDFVFTMDAGSTVSGFDARNGRRIWRIDLEDATNDDDFFGGGIAYSGGRVFVTTGFAKVFALDAKRGTVLWEQRVSGPVRGGPAVEYDRVFVVTLDNQGLALDAESGSVLWSHRGVQELAGLLGSATPAVAGETVVMPYSSGELFALSVEDGNVLWSENLSGLAQIDPLADIAQVRGLPVIDRGKVFAISHAGRMVALDLGNGARLWDIDLGGIEMPWLAGDFIFLLTNDSQVVCLLRRTGAIRWVRPLPRFADEEDQEDPIRWFGPVLAGDRLILTNSEEEAVAISPYSGKILGLIDLPDGATVSPVVSNQGLYILTDDAELLAYR